ncbi:MAG: hypothetical protein F4Y94_11125, partial [Chloroflexi bacterium]|nr:hypothetical protein [Chloroflexota bacterium]
MARVTYKYQPLTVRVDVAGVTFPATLASRVEYSEAQDDYVWGMDVQLNATSGAVPILEDGDVVTLWPPVRDPVQLTIAPVSSDQFRLQGTGYPLFLSPDDPPEGRDRPSEESVMAGLEHRSVAYIIQDGRIRGDLLQHINAVLARLEEAEPEDEWEKELIAQATALATELRELISS